MAQKLTGMSRISPNVSVVSYKMIPLAEDAWGPFPAPGLVGHDITEYFVVGCLLVIV